MAQFTFLELLLLVFISFQLIQARSAPKPENEGFIVGGKTAHSGQFPYQVSLREPKANFHFCGGSIINHRFCITAAHCLSGRTTANTVVVVGTIERKSVTSGTVHASAALIVHKGYNQTALTNDISLVKTVTPIVFSNLVQPIRLAESYTGGGLNGIASGWGRLSKGGDLPDLLQFLNVKTLTNGECKKKLGDEIAPFVYDSIICIYVPYGQGMCNGDSGGPLAINGKLVGLASWVVPCGVGYPDAFVRVVSHRQWIISHSI